MLAHAVPPAVAAAGSGWTPQGAEAQQGDWEARYNRFCTKCGTRNNPPPSGSPVPVNKFCFNCGSALAKRLPTHGGPEAARPRRAAATQPQPQPQPEGAAHEQAPPAPEPQNSWEAHDADALKDGRAFHTAVRFCNDAKAVVASVDTKPWLLGWVDPQTGNTAIHVAAQNGHEVLVNMLLMRGAEVNAQNLKGNTALHMAVMYNLHGTVSILTASGADGSLCNRYGYRARNGLVGDKGADGVPTPLDHFKGARTPRDAMAALDAALALDEDLFDKAKFASAVLSKRSDTTVFTPEVERRAKEVLRR